MNFDRNCEISPPSSGIKLTLIFSRTLCSEKLKSPDFSFSPDYIRENAFEKLNSDLETFFAQPYATYVNFAMPPIQHLYILGSE